MKLELSGTTKLPYSAKLVEHVRRYHPNAEQCHVNVSIEDVYIKEISLNGIGIFYDFPGEGNQQIGWIPKNELAEVKLMRNTYSNLVMEAYISSITMKEFTLYKKLSILLELKYE